MSPHPPPPSAASPSGPWSFVDVLLPRSCAVSSEATGGGVLAYVPPMEGHSAVVVRVASPPPSRNVPARPQLYLLSQMAAMPSGAAVLGPWLGRALQHLERTHPAAAADAFWGLFGGDSGAARRAWESPATRVDALLEALGAGGGGGGDGSGGKKGSSSKKPSAKGGKGKGGKAGAKPSGKSAAAAAGGVEVMLVYGGVVSEHPPLLTLTLQAADTPPTPAAEEGGDALPPRPPGPQVLSPYGADGRDGRVWAFTAEPTPAWTVHYPLPGAPAPPARWLHSAVSVTLPAAGDDGADAGGGAPSAGGGKGAGSKSRVRGGGGRGVGGMSRFAASSDSAVQSKSSKGKGGGRGKGKGGGAAGSDSGSGGGGEQYMVVFGGCGLHLEALNDVWLYRFSDNSWRELLPHGYGPSPRWLAAAAAVLPPRVLEAPKLGPELVVPPGSYYERMAASAHPELVGTGADAADLATSENAAVLRNAIPPRASAGDGRGAGGKAGGKGGGPKSSRKGGGSKPNVRGRSRFADASGEFPSLKGMLGMAKKGGSAAASAAAGARGGGDAAIVPPDSVAPVRPPLSRGEAAEAGRLEEAYRTLAEPPAAPPLASGVWDGGESAAFIRMRRRMGLDPEPAAVVAKDREAVWRRGLYHRPIAPQAGGEEAPPDGDAAAGDAAAAGNVGGADASREPPAGPALLLELGAGGRAAMGGKEGKGGKQRQRVPGEPPTYETHPDADYGILSGARSATEGGGAASGVYVFGGVTAAGRPLGDHFMLHLFAAASSSEGEGAAAGGGAGPDIVSVWELLNDMNAGPTGRQGAAAAVVTSSPAESGVGGYAEALSAGNLKYPPFPSPGSQWVLLFGGAQSPTTRTIVKAAVSGQTEPPPTPAELLRVAIEAMKEEDKTYATRKKK